MNPFKSICTKPFLLVALLLSFNLNIGYAEDSKPVFQAPSLQAGNSGSGDTVLPDLFTGTMSYKVPIEVPPGRNGMDPGLALLYRSSNGNGWVGVGWELEAGAIERSTKKGLKYDDNQDTFIFRMAGATIELVSIGVINGIPEYRAKIEGAFNRFQFVSSSYWVVTDKKGTQYFLGRSFDSCQTGDAVCSPCPPGVSCKPCSPPPVFKWCIDMILDTNGNYMIFSYVKDQGQIYLDQIDYAGNGTLSPTNHVYFHREDRTDAPVIYTTNVAVKTAKRLSTIDIFSDGNRVRNYKLNYAPNGSASTGRSMLASVQQFDKNGTSGSALPATTFTYYNGGTSFDSSSWLVSTSELVADDYNYVIPGDFNGDGRGDIAYTRPGWGRWWMLISDGSSFTKKDWPVDMANDLVTDAYNFIRTGDFNGDGKTDIAYTRPGWNNWYVLVSNGNSFTKLDWGGLAGDLVADPYNFIRTGDFNGDGKVDIAYTRPYWGNWYVLVSDGSGFNRMNWEGSSGDLVNAYNFIQTGDFNGDGKTDIAYTRPGWNNWYVLVSDGNSFTKIDWGGSASNLEADSYDFIQAGDFNGDGKTDIAYTRPGWTNWYVLVSDGNRFNKIDWGGSPGDLVADLYNFMQAGDFNGDGKTDIAYTRPGWNNWYVLVSNGGGFNKINWGGSASDLVSDSYNFIEAGDFDGDGKTDIAYARPNWTDWKMRLPNDPQPDLLYSLSNGLGATTTIGYMPSTSYTNTLLPFPVQTVSSVTTNDGNGNTSETQYYYAGGFIHIGERDFRGFNHVTVTGPAGANGEKTITETWFHQGNDTGVDANSPDVSVGYMKGKPYKVRVSDGTNPNNKFVETTTSYAYNNTTPYFNPPSEVISTLYNGSATQGKQTRTVYASYDAYGNVLRTDQYGDYTNSNSDTTDDRTITKTYGYNATAWIVGLPTNDTVYKGISTASADKMVATDYYYDQVTDCNTAATNQTPDKGNLTRIERWLDTAANPEVRMAYNSYGNLVCSRDANGNTTAITVYDGSYTYPKTVTNPLGYQATTNYYGIDVSGNGLYGQVQSVTDIANNTTTSYEYDNFGRKTKTILHDGSYSTISYNNFGAVGSQNVQTTSAGLSSWTYFDGLGRTILEKGTGPDGKTIAKQTIYDARGAVYKTSLPYFDTDTAKYSTYAYDPVGRVNSVLMPDGTTTQACYNDWATITIDANSHKKRTINDAYGRLKQVEEYAGTASSCDGGTLYATTTYTYDVLGNLRFVTDAKGNQNEMRYDTLGRKTYMHDPDMGNWNYYYDANGNMTSQLDSMNQWIFFQYDALNRLLQKDYNNQKTLGSGDIIYNYDETHTAYGKGKLTSIKDQSVSGPYSYNSRFYYDSLGEVTQLDKVVDGVNYTTAYGYDQLGRSSTITYPDNAIVNYSYNGPLLGSVYEGSTTYAAYNGYNALGQPGSVAYNNNLVTTTYTYNNSGNGSCPKDNYRLCSIYTSKNGSVLQNMLYDYDNVGNITSIADYTDNNQTHEADKIARLNALNNMTYGYSTNGIRPHAVLSAGGNIYIYDNNPNNDTFGNGNMTSGAGRTIIYDPENRPLTINNGTTTSFYYDGNGERVKKAAGSTATVYINGLYECTGGTCTKYIFANGQRIAAETASNTLYYHPDHLGGSSVITDANGNEVEYIAYYPFGQTRIDSGSASVPYKYTGQELDGSTGLYNYNARLYDPVLGRFISADSVIPDPGDPQAFNRYAYVRNNPIRYTDPSGHFLIEAMVVGAVVGAISSGSQNNWTAGSMMQGAFVGAFAGAAGYGAGTWALTAYGGGGLGAMMSGGIVGGAAGGAVGGGMYAGMYGGDIGQGMLMGAQYGAIAGGATAGLMYAGVPGAFAAAGGGYTSGYAQCGTACGEQGAMSAFGGQVLHNAITISGYGTEGTAPRQGSSKWQEMYGKNDVYVTTPSVSRNDLLWLGIALVDQGYSHTWHTKDFVYGDDGYVPSGHQYRSVQSNVSWPDQSYANNNFANYSLTTNSCSSRFGYFTPGQYYSNYNYAGQGTYWWGR